METLEPDTQIGVPDLVSLAACASAMPQQGAVSITFCNGPLVGLPPLLARLTIQTSADLAGLNGSGNVAVQCRRCFAGSIGVMPSVYESWRARAQG